MRLKPIKLRAALNKAYLKTKVSREAIEDFKAHLITLLDRLQGKETEEHHKRNIATFLEDAFYKQSHHLNAKGDIDLAIYTGKSPKDPIGVIIEAKRPDNVAEMIDADNPSAKAMFELILYYLRERIDAQNHDLRHLVITNGYDWYLYDATDFDRIVFTNGKLKKDYQDWKEGRKSASSTNFFYDSIAKPFILQNTDQELPFVHFDLRDYDKIARNPDKADDAKLIVLYKLLSPSHLLKEPFANDSNSLNKDFYSELLHIIGLEEAKDKNKKVIRRPDEGKRIEGSLLEKTIERLEVYRSLSRVTNRRTYGEHEAEQTFSIGLELCITWINRILFLKLLEAQLQGYHKGDKDYKFLDPTAIGDFDELFDLFFMVLACRPSERRAKVQQRYAKVPYLNSSLFEESKLEIEAVGINQLDNKLQVEIHSRTVLKDAAGKRLKGHMGTLEYLLRFLEAYDFSAEGGEEIQEENKTLINASVLGLIFEKINGYRDGSFFTPGFITMYMCRETLRRAVVQKFNAQYGWNVDSIEALRDQMQPGKPEREEYNALVNSLRVCDPAVGSGHFLVSALNELLAIKSDLGILSYSDGSRVREFGLRVENDELVVLDYDEDKLFHYLMGKAGKPQPELQKLQEALFHEKQKIIENCLFGVDINPNSVKICRLRLWIELLKNAYYTSESGYTELETLPNIDINIKQGNSLVSRFGLQEDLKTALKDSGHTIAQYREAVQSYRHASGRDEKATVLALIDKVKGSFRDTIDKPLQRKIATTRGLLANAEQEIANLRAFGQAISDKVQQDHDRAKAQFEAAVIEKKEIEDNALFSNAFEWRFEFPEVLNDDGDFDGFDVVIANPPYIRQEEIKDLKPHFEKRFETYVSSADLYVYFVELGINLLRSHGHFCYIIPNKWMRAGYGTTMRNWLKGQDLQGIVDFGDLPVFEEATTYPCVLSMAKRQGKGSLMAAEVTSLAFEDLAERVRATEFQVATDSLAASGWTLMRNDKAAVLEKIRSQGVPLGEYVEGKIYYGIKTGLNEAFVIDAATRERLIAEDARSAEVIKPFLAGRDVKRWRVNDSGNYLILFPNGWTKSQLPKDVDPWEFVSNSYPAVAAHLSPFEIAARKRYDQGQYWWELRACDYYHEFEKPKIIWPGISSVVNSFAFDNNNFYGNDNNQIIVTDQLEVLAILNSSVTKFFLSSICDFVRGGFARLKVIYVQKVPIPLIPDAAKSVLVDIVKLILERRIENSGSDISSLESEIDRLVYGLYGLTEEEILVVEGGGTVITKSI